MNPSSGGCDLRPATWQEGLEVAIACARMKRMQLLELCSHAEIAHGSDAMVGSLDIYAFAKSAEGAGVEGMRKLLGKRFDRARKDAPAPASA